ncbi:MAG TPA: CoA transferase, partial [Acidimicrobiales bacterium]|nr:CoA transferase [Acidimicrobiales bacterium]
TALAAGLLYRRRTGKGVHLDVSQVEAAAFTLSPWILDYDVNGHIESRRGNRSDRMAPHGAFECKGDDRWVAIACWDDDDWARFARVLELDTQVRDKFETVASRLEGVDELERIVSAWTKDRSPEEVASSLQEAGIEAVPVADLADACRDPQLAHRGHFVVMDHPFMATCGYERNGFRLSDADAGYHRTGPTLGQDNDYVLGEILRIDESERKSLSEAGALE